MRPLLAFVLSLFTLLSPAFAQVPARDVVPDADARGAGPGEEAPVADEQAALPVFRGGAPDRRFNVETMNDIGEDGEIYTTNPPAPYGLSGVLVLANPATPDLSMRLGNTLGSSRFGVYDSAGVGHFKVLGDGKILLGKDAQANPLYQVQMRSTADGSASMLGWTHTTIEASTTQDDTGGWLIAYQNVADTMVNSGSAYGLRTRAWLYGPGELSATYGAYIQSGLYPSSAVTGTTGKVVRAYGMVLDLGKGTGSIEYGYGLYIRDVQASENKSYSIYQLGLDDVNYFGGRMGIGLTAPSSKLHVRDTVSNFAIVDTIGAADLSAGIQFKNDARQWQLAVNGADADKFQITDSTASAARVTILADGKVGIGTTTPVETLHVAGNLKVTGTITGDTVIGAVYQDLAEWVPATTDLAPGTVVVLNHGKNNEVMASHGPYDTSVAGVVSAQPGVILGVGGEGKEQIATTGRVKVRVDARRGAIAVGDLLVTGELAGTAMKSEPMAINGRSFHQPGTIIGKALEPLEDGIGEILVLLSMQ